MAFQEMLATIQKKKLVKTKAHCRKQPVKKNLLFPFYVPFRLMDEP